MNLPKKKIVLSAFAAIYFFLFAILGFLVFFNTGLDIVEENQNGAKELLVKNITSREIKNITVHALAGEKTILLSKIPSLGPGAKSKVDLSPLVNQQSAVILVESPFYKKTEKTLVLGQAAREIALTIRAPELAFVGEETIVSMEACNRGKTKELQATMEFDVQKIQAENTSTPFSLEQGKCITRDFKILPLQAGQTTIYFNIKTGDYTEKIPKTLEVKE